MKVLKFGGSSLANADKFLRVASIVESESSNQPIAVVLSAPQGVTNLLVDIALRLKQNRNPDRQIAELREKVSNIRLELSSSLQNQEFDECINETLEHLQRLVEGAALLGHCPNQTEAQILGVGENLSTRLMTQVFKAKGQSVSNIDPLRFLTTEDESLESLVDIRLSKRKFEACYTQLESIAIMPGFVALSPSGEPTVLGRNGSDYSASVLAVCTQSSHCEIWTDVDGVYNVDPRLVDNARLVRQMSFNEALELSYFGAKVLHPKTIAPLSQANIPCVIKNTYAPEKAGTSISHESSAEETVKAITNLDDVAMVNVSGPGLKSKLDLTHRVFAALAREKIAVILISQSSSQTRISFCVAGCDASRANQCLQNEFELELKNQLLDPVSLQENLSVVTIVGDKMQQQQGIAAKFFGALSKAKVNIIAIAQDSSERSISAVVRSQRIEDAVSVCHQTLYAKRHPIDAFIVGCGTVGAALIDQIRRQQKDLIERDIDLKVFGIANSRQLYLNSNGIDLNENWKDALSKEIKPFSIERINQFVKDNSLFNPVIIDVTSSEPIAMSYADYLAAGYHVVAANKKANTTDMDYYRQLRVNAQSKHRRFLYETNVAAGLPVIDNLQSLLRAGDKLIKFEGILSGSLSFIFGELHNGLSLSEATKKARDLGYTEPNPAEDLSGLDVARKVLIIAREAGIDMDLDDIQLESILPVELAEIADGDEFMQKLPALDASIQEKVSTAELNKQVLRYVAKIEKGVCEVKIESVDKAHPLYTVDQGENALAIHTQYYQPVPYVIRGYGAGAEVTAAGLFADVLRTLVWELN